VQAGGFLSIITRKIRTCLRLSWRERRQATGTIILVALVRLGLSLLPFRTMQRVCEYCGRTRRRTDPAGTPEIVRAIRLASRYVPRATCLTQALATQILLGRNGHSGQLHIGVAVDAKQGFRAHAWVESQGKILVGGSEELDQYAPMLMLDNKAR
jgi:hypothetical protein